MMIYNVRPGQTFAEICEEIHLENPDYLRDFHNTNCSLTEHFEGNIINGTRIFIPTAQQIAELNQKIRDNNESFYDFPNNGKFPFAYNLWDGTYHISRTSYLNNKLISTNNQKIRLNLEFIKNDCYYFQLTEYDFKKNGEASESKVSTLAKMCMEVIYPIRLIVNSHGKIQSIELTKKLLQVFSDLEAIKQFTSDIYASDYIEKMKKIIENPKEILRRFGNTLLNTFLFGSFYRIRLEEWTHSQIYHDFYPWIFAANAIHFELQNTLYSKENFDDIFMKIKQKGICSDHRSLKDLFTDFEHNKNIPLDQNSINCEHFAEYLFNRKDYSLQRIEATFQNFINGNIEKEIFLLEKRL
ncbi:MAG: hypothetical protein LBE39_11875 [Flavobacteriaceae bacterium]|jgi:hypothetical protein|nr:hypothetical protein [Flavobacteriaceae bacterium]